MKFMVLFSLHNMTDLNDHFWNNRYITNDMGWDIGYVSTPIKEYIDQLTDKSIKILIPGCGNAYEAEYLFKNGFKNVFVIDWSDEALKNFSNRLPEFPKENLLCVNFFDHEANYDLMIEQTFFCAILPSLRNKYAKHAASLLTPKGKLVGLLFDDPLNSDRPPFGGNKTIYTELFSPYFEIAIMETAKNSIPSRKERELFVKMVRKQ